MRIEPAPTASAVPRWAIAIVCMYSAFVALYTVLGWYRGGELRPLCVFRVLTGRPCPTCGTTRMVVGVLRGDLRAAAACNPLMFAAGTIGSGLLVLRVGFRRRVVWITSDRMRRVSTIGLISAVLVNWLYLLCMR